MKTPNVTCQLSFWQVRLLTPDSSAFYGYTEEKRVSKCKVLPNKSILSWPCFAQHADATARMCSERSSPYDNR